MGNIVWTSPFSRYHLQSLPFFFHPAAATTHPHRPPSHPCLGPLPASPSSRRKATMATAHEPSSGTPLPCLGQPFRPPPTASSSRCGAPRPYLRSPTSRPQAHHRWPHGGSRRAFEVHATVATPKSPGYGRWLPNLGRLPWWKGTAQH
jgi:hypothetical protein